MEKKRNMDQGFDWKKKKSGAASEGSALVKTSSTPSYAAGRDSVQTTTTPYAAGLQAGVNSQTKLEKTEQMQEPKPEPEIPKENGNPPYIMGRDEGKPPEIPYAPGLQAGFGPKSSAPDRREPEPEPEKQAPRRTSLAVREELETLERSYDDMLQEAEAWESQASRQKTPEKMSQWEKKGRNLRKKAAGLEPYLDSLQKEWEYAMDWEWEEKKKQEGYRDPTLWDLTVGSFQKAYDTAQFGRESFRDMLGDEDNRKAEYEEKLAGEEYKFIPEGWWQKRLSGASTWLGEEVNKAASPETVVAVGGSAGAAALMGQAGPQAAVPEEVLTVPAAIATGYKAGTTAVGVEIQAGLAYDAMLRNGVSEETAGNIAAIIGGINGIVDVLPIDFLIDSIRILNASGAPGEASKVFWDELEKRGIDISEAILKAKAQEKISETGVQIGTKLDMGKEETDEVEIKDGEVPKGENPWISDDTARKLLEDPQMMEYLGRRGGLKLEKGMTLDQKVLAVKAAVEVVIQKQNRNLSDRSGN